MMSGEALLPFSDLLAPTKESTRQTLIQLRCDLGLSRGHMAALLGVRKDHLRRWEKGTRHPIGFSPETGVGARHPPHPARQADGTPSPSPLGVGLKKAPTFIQEYKNPRIQGIQEPKLVGGELVGANIVFRVF